MFSVRIASFFIIFRKVFFLIFLVFFFNFYIGINGISIWYLLQWCIISLWWSSVKLLSRPVIWVICWIICRIPFRLSLVFVKCRFLVWFVLFFALVHLVLCSHRLCSYLVAKLCSVGQHGFLLRLTLSCYNFLLIVPDCHTKRFTGLLSIHCTKMNCYGCNFDITILYLFLFTYFLFLC